MTDKEKLEQLKLLGKKYSEATEYFDPIVANGFTPLKFPADKFINQIGKEILGVIES